MTDDLHEVTTVPPDGDVVEPRTCFFPAIARLLGESNLSCLRLVRENTDDRRTLAAFQNGRHDALKSFFMTSQKALWSALFGFQKPMFQNGGRATVKNAPFLPFFFVIFKPIEEGVGDVVETVGRLGRANRALYAATAEGTGRAD